MTLSPTSTSTTPSKVSELIDTGLGNLDASGINVDGISEMFSGWLDYIKDFFSDAGFELDVSAGDVAGMAKDYVVDKVTDFGNSISGIMDAFNAAGADGKFEMSEIKNILAEATKEEPVAAPAVPPSI